MFNRYAIVNAYAAFATLHGNVNVCARIRKNRALYDMCGVSLYPGEHSRRDLLQSFADDGEALFSYFELVRNKLGDDAAAKASDEWARINDTAGVTIHVENSDGDPMAITFHVSDPIASEWAENDQYIAGDTWEEADGTDFVYACTYWYPGIFDELKKEGYDFDFSSYGEPDDRDIAIAKHAAECPLCEYDFSKAEEHCENDDDLAQAAHNAHCVESEAETL